MKRFLPVFLAILLLLSFTGLVDAQKIVDTADGPEVWVTSVYNNSTSTISAGDIVVWDISSSTGDNDNYVNTTTTADTTLAAGIVWPADIAGKSIGSIAIRATGITVNTLGGTTVPTSLCTSGTTGRADACSESAGDPNRVGYCTAADSSKSCVAYISVL